MLKKVFISSSLVGMRTYRRAAERAAGDSGFEAVRLERKWQSPSQKERDLSLVRRNAQEVTSCDVFIRILTDRVGARISGSSHTLLEHEFRVAIEAELPVLLYAHPSSTFFSRLKGEDFDEAELDFLAQCRVVSSIESPEELYEKVHRDLARWDEAEAQSRRLVMLPQLSMDQTLCLLNDPSELARCPDRFFEELVAELLHADGWDVELVLRSNMPGPDIFACSRTMVHGQPVKLLVECKRFKEERRVDVREVRNLVYWLNEEYQATLGMIATTSSFTRDAKRAVSERHRWRISLREQADIIGWLASSVLLTGGRRETIE